MRAFRDYFTGKTKLIKLTKVDLQALKKLKNYICFNDAPGYLQVWMLRHGNLTALVTCGYLRVEEPYVQLSGEIRRRPVETLCYSRPDIRIKVVIPPEVHKNLCT